MAPDYSVCPPRQPRLGSPFPSTCIRPGRRRETGRLSHCPNAGHSLAAVRRCGDPHGPITRCAPPAVVAMVAGSIPSAAAASTYRDRTGSPAPRGFNVFGVLDSGRSSSGATDFGAYFSYFFFSYVSASLLSALFFLLYRTAFASDWRDARGGFSLPTFDSFSARGAAIAGAGASVIRARNRWARPELCFAADLVVGAVGTTLPVCTSSIVDRDRRRRAHARRTLSIAWTSAR